MFLKNASLTELGRNSELYALFTQMSVSIERLLTTDHGVNESKSGVVPSVTHYELMLIHI